MYKVKNGLIICKIRIYWEEVDFEEGEFGRNAVRLRMKPV